MIITRALAENFAPYASAKSVLQVINRYRDRGLPEPLTPDALEQIGVTATMTSPTYRTLRFLGLVNDDGIKTDSFERLRRATSDEYPGVLEGVIRNAYADVFAIVDPAEDDEATVADAFRKYDPANQRRKMTSLFVGLCEESGILQRQRKRRSRPDRAANNSRQSEVKSTTVDDQRSPMVPEIQSELDFRLISAIFQQLPKSGIWTSDKRHRWMEAMTSAVDLLCEVQDDEDIDEGNEHVDFNP